MAKKLKSIKGLSESRTATYLVTDAYDRLAQSKRDRNKFLHNRHLDPKPVKTRFGWKKVSLRAW